MPKFLKTVLSYMLCTIQILTPNLLLAMDGAQDAEAQPFPQHDLYQQALLPNQGGLPMALLSRNLAKQDDKLILSLTQEDINQNAFLNLKHNNAQVGMLFILNGDVSLKTLCHESWTLYGLFNATSLSVSTLGLLTFDPLSNISLSKDAIFKGHDNTASKGVIHAGTLDVGGMSLFKTTQLDWKGNIVTQSLTVSATQIKKHEGSTTTVKKGWLVDAEGMRIAKKSSLQIKGNSEGTIKNFHHYGMLQSYGQWLIENTLYSNEGTIIGGQLFRIKAKNVIEKGNVQIYGYGLVDSNSSIAFYKNFWANKLIILSQGTIIINTDACVGFNLACHIFGKESLQHRGMVKRLERPTFGLSPLSQLAPLQGPLLKLFGQLPNTLIMQGERNFVNTGKVESNGTSITYLSKGQVLYEGTTHGGVFKGNDIFFNGLQARINGFLKSYNTINIECLQEASINAQTHSKHLNIEASKLDVKGKHQTDTLDTFSLLKTTVSARVQALIENHKSYELVFEKGQHDSKVFNAHALNNLLLKNTLNADLATYKAKNIEAKGPQTILESLEAEAQDTLNISNLKTSFALLTTQEKLALSSLQVNTLVSHSKSTTINDSAFKRGVHYAQEENNFKNCTYETSFKSYADTHTLESVQASKAEISADNSSVGKATLKDSTFNTLKVSTQQVHAYNIKATEGEFLSNSYLGSKAEVYNSLFGVLNVAYADSKIENSVIKVGKVNSNTAAYLKNSMIAYADIHSKDLTLKNLVGGGGNFTAIHSHNLGNLGFNNFNLFTHTLDGSGSYNNKVTNIQAHTFIPSGGNLGGKVFNAYVKERFDTSRAILGGSKSTYIKLDTSDYKLGLTQGGWMTIEAPYYDNFDDMLIGQGQYQNLLGCKGLTLVSQDNQNITKPLYCRRGIGIIAPTITVSHPVTSGIGIDFRSFQGNMIINGPLTAPRIALSSACGIVSSEYLYGGQSLSVRAKGPFIHTHKITTSDLSVIASEILYCAKNGTMNQVLADTMYHEATSGNFTNYGYTFRPSIFSHVKAAGDILIESLQNGMLRASMYGGTGIAYQRPDTQVKGLLGLKLESEGRIVNRGGIFDSLSDGMTSARLGFLYDAQTYTTTSVHTKKGGNWVRRKYTTTIDIHHHVIRPERKALGNFYTFSSEGGLDQYGLSKNYLAGEDIIMVSGPVRSFCIDPWHEQHVKVIRRMNPLVGALVGLAAGIATGGAGLSVASSLGFSSGTVGAAMVQGTVMGVSAQTASGMFMNQGNLGRTMKGVFSSSGLRSLGISAVGAGLTQGLCNKLGIKQLSPHDLKTMSHGQIFTNHLQRSLINSGVSITLDTTIGTHKLNQAFLNGIKSTISGTLGGYGSNQIVKAFGNKDLLYFGSRYLLADMGYSDIVLDDYFKQLLARGGLGAMTGAILYNNPGKGALTSAVGNVMSEVILDLMVLDSAFNLGLEIKNTYKKEGLLACHKHLGSLCAALQGDFPAMKFASEHRMQNSYYCGKACL